MKMRSEKRKKLKSGALPSSIALLTYFSSPASDVFAASGDDSLTRTNIFAPLSTAPAQVRSITAGSGYLTCGGLLAARGDFWIDLSCRIYAKLSALWSCSYGVNRETFKEHGGSERS